LTSRKISRTEPEWEARAQEQAMDTSYATKIKGLDVVDVARGDRIKFDFDLNDPMKKELLAPRPVEWHNKRMRLMLQAHPEIKEYCKPSLFEGFILAVLWVIHVGFAAFVAPLLPWWALAIATYTIGSVLCFCLFVGGHDLGHKLVFKNMFLIRLGQLALSSTMWAPVTLIFGPHHLNHHATLGTEDDDDNIVFSVFNHTPKWFCTPFRRFLYLTVGLPTRQLINHRIFLARFIAFFIKGPKLFDSVRQLSVGTPLTMFFGVLDALVAYLLMSYVYQIGNFNSVVYLIMSNCCMYGWGANPAVGWFMMNHFDRTNVESKRKIANWEAKRDAHYASLPTPPEHIAKLGVTPEDWGWLVRPVVQPTCSLNTKSYWYTLMYGNAPLHTEHHDFPQVPAIYLHRIREACMEFYEPLWGPSTLSEIVSEFIWDCQEPTFHDFANMEFRYHARAGGKAVKNGKTE
jgi:fatty acid desaturase